MCFSAPASFTACGILMPTGIYCLRKAITLEKSYLPLASWPLFFGIQQAIEGFLWLEIGSDKLSLIPMTSLGFLFFAYFFWLFFVPFSALSLESKPEIKKVLLLFSLLGFFYGAFLYIPLLLKPSWLEIGVSDGSLYYNTRLIFDNFLTKKLSWVGYALIILVPLELSSQRSLNFLGFLISLSALVTYILFNQVFISIWCFFAAILSTYIVYALNQKFSSSQPLSEI